ncbi:MAG: hypothetical protein WD355_11185 [Balneolaceae bacterium]
MYRYCLYYNISILLLPAAVPVVYGQSTFGAAAAGLNSLTAYPEKGPWPVLNNPSHLDVEKPVIGVFGFQTAGFTELTDLAAAIALKIPGSSAGIGIHQYGFSLFRETRIRLACSISAGPIRTGVALNYLTIHQGDGFGSASGRSLDIGFSTILHPGITLSGKVDNLTRARFGALPGSIPHRVSAGISYHLSDRSLSLLEWVRETPYPDSWRFGIQSFVLPSLPIRGGVATEPGIWSFGFGYQTDLWEVNVAVQHHELLGISPGFDLIVQF